MQRFEEITIAIGHLTFAAKVWPGSRTLPILALHGWLDNANSFDPLAPLLDRNTVCLDLPGHGKSSHLDRDSFYHFVDWLPHVFEFIKAMGWQKIDLIGHSMGAAIGMCCAAVRPDLFHKIVLIEGLTPLFSESRDTVSRIRTYLKQRQASGNKWMSNYATLEDAANRRMQSSDMNLENSRTIAARGTVATDQGFIWSSDPRLMIASPLRFTRSHVEALLGGVTCPTLVIRAQPGMHIDESLFTELVGKISDVKVDLVEGGHHVHMENPRQIQTIISRFLN